MSIPLRIVLIDDNPDDRELAARALRQKLTGVNITEPRSAAALDAVLEQGDFDLIVTDYRFHWSDGLAVLRAAKARDPFCPVVMFTATGTQELAVEAMKEGLDDYVIKASSHFVRLPVAVLGALRRSQERRRLAVLEAERARLLAQEQKARWRATLLADISTLLATSLDYETTLRQVAELMVPRLADWCGVYMPAAGAAKLVAVAHDDPSRAALAYELDQRYPSDPNTPGSVASVMRGGQPILSPDLSPESLAAVARDADHLKLMQALGLRSLMSVPLTARGRPLGVMTFARSTAEQYGPDDLVFVEEIARRAALAIDNARLYADAQRAADRAARLQTVTAALSAALTPAQVAAVVAEQCVSALRASACAVGVLVDDDQVLEIVHAVGWPPDTLDTWVRLPADAALPFPDAVRSNTLRVFETPQELAAHYPQFAEAPHRHATWALIPLALQRHALGGMVVGFAERRVLGEEERALMLALGQQAAQALERSRLYATAQEAVAARDQFLSIASHELRTPLTSLLGYVELMERRVLQQGGMEPPHRRALSVVGIQARRLHRLVEALLDISRIQLGQLQLERQRLDLCALAESVAAELQPRLEARHTLALDLSAEPVRILGDGLRLYQVVLNLLENAIKYSPEGGQIALGVRAAGDRANLSVTDQGIGIPQADLARLFTRFYRASNVNGKQISGMGLGLYIVREVVALHQGSVTVESDEGQGTTFTVHLPLVQ
jgi:signal transduction histidine kinase/DNA-binding response OmpR family regulator